MKFLNSFLVCLIISLFVDAQVTKNVLFIGNSLTYYNDMPKVVQKMLDEQKIKVKIDQATIGGYTLFNHALFTIDSFGVLKRVGKNQLSPTVKKILSKKWEIVILQEAPINMLIPEKLATNSGPAIIYLDSIIKAHKGNTVFYQGYAGQKYPVKYCHPVLSWQDFDEHGIHEQLFNKFTDKISMDKLNNTFVCSDSFQNSSQEFLSLKCVYDRAANFIRAETVPVGFAFEICKIKYPEIPLYQNVTDNHPSKQGSYLIACLFYRYLSHKSITNIHFSLDISVAEAEKLRKLANQITF